MPSQQTVEKLEFAREASFYYPFFATGFPGQKKHFYPRKCANVRRKSPLGDFSTVSREGDYCPPVLFTVS